jgi:hypothetical protein
MPYAAVLEGKPDTIELIAPFFTNPLLKIGRRDTRWTIESCCFEQCRSTGDARVVATTLLSQLHQVLALYLGLYSPFSINVILTLNDQDQVVSAQSSADIQIKVFGSPEVLGPRGSDSLGNEVFSRAATDTTLREALSLVEPQHPPTWARIFDVIEFLGGARSISAAGFASRQQVNRVRQTANYYRHLDSPKKKTRFPLIPQHREKLVNSRSGF